LTSCSCESAIHDWGGKEVVKRGAGAGAGEKAGRRPVELGSLPCILQQRHRRGGAFQYLSNVMFTNVCHPEGHPDITFPPEIKGS
jgi:hypothetical protein